MVLRIKRRENVIKNEPIYYRKYRKNSKESKNGKMMDDYGLSGYKIHPYGEK